MSNIVVKTVQVKRGNKADLIRVLKGALRPADGEPIFEIDTGKLKFGDGIHDYESLDYFKTGDVEVEDALDGQILVYNATLDKWEAKVFTDEKSIEYTENGLQIAGFNQSSQGAVPVSNVQGNQKIVWQQPITDEDLQAAVSAASTSAYNSEASAVQALAAQAATETLKRQTEQIRDTTMEIVNKKFWYGTQSEYMNNIINQNKLTEGTIYFIYDYDYDGFANENNVTGPENNNNN